MLSMVRPLANTTDKLAPELEALPALGQTANINMEQLLGLKPDVVLGLVNQHKKYESQLQANNIPTVLLITMVLKIMYQC